MIAPLIEPATAAGSGDDAGLKRADLRALMHQGIAERLAALDAEIERAKEFTEAARGIAREELQGARQRGARPDKAGEPGVKLTFFPDGKPMHIRKILFLWHNRKA
jgi:hypothetical protein